MNIIAGDITLRAVEFEDQDILLAMINSPEVESAVVGWSFPVSKQQQRDWISRLGPADCKLIIDYNGQGVGLATLSDIDHKNSCAGINIKLTTEFRGQGIASIALNLLTSYAFEEMNLNCLSARILEGNEASIKLFKRQGYVLEGQQRQRIYKQGRFHDLLSYSLLRQEFHRLRGER